ncbi:hypothetical protein ACWEO2_18580, partial [Nocardia sp. NPDC004278]
MLHDPPSGEHDGASLTSDRSRPVSRPSRRSACAAGASLGGSDREVLVSAIGAVLELDSEITEIT